MKTATFIIIAGRKDIDNFMKIADLFNAKNLGVIEEFTIEYKEKTSLTLKNIGKIIPVIKEALESSGHVVSFIHLEQIQEGNVITLNDSVLPYYDKNIREVSDGFKSFVLKDYIEKNTPFKCKIDENYFITDIY